MNDTVYDLNEDEKRVLEDFFGAEFGSYMTNHAPSRVVISIRSLSETLGWTKYRVGKAVKKLKERNLIERASVGIPASYSYGEYAELIDDVHPPINGFAMTNECFDTEMYKKAYKEWERSLAEWADGDFGDK